MDERKAAILQAVVEAYINDAQPVGSGTVAGAPGIDVSAATVRNEMAALEREGFLVQPHTSAGRIPTDAGYRFFVDQMGGPGVLGAGETRQIRSFFEHARGEIEGRLESTSRLLADLTDYAAVVVGPSHDPATVRSAQLVELTATDVLCVVVLSDGAVVKQHLESTAPVGGDLLPRATTRLAEVLDGRPLGTTVHADGSGDADVDALVGQALDALGVIQTGGSVFVGGTARVAAQFDAIETVREVLTILEEQLLVVTLLTDVLDRGLSVAIGAETGLEPLSECSVVVAPYVVEGEEAGTIGLVGPTRMDYPKALAAVTVVGRRLGRSLEAGR